MEGCVAVYIDFDNVVISRYNAVHGENAWRDDNPRGHGRSPGSKNPVAVKLAAARLDIGAIIDFAASFGSISLNRAYADWSVPVNASYRTELVDRSLHLVQLFMTSGLKNGADIRIAVDAVEDLMRHPEITHVVLVAGDSDFVPLAQSCKQLGRYVVGIGVKGSISTALVSACHEYLSYSQLPGVAPAPAAASTVDSAKDRTAPKAVTKPAAQSSVDAAATKLLVRAVRVGLQKSDDDWVHAAGIKSQMQRMDPAFAEKTLGYSSFRAFVESRTQHVVSRLAGSGQLMVKLK